ncbi:polymorphic toxin-type HINT domain-containing protein [Streptomyces sp. NPDC001296]
MALATAKTGRPWSQFAALVALAGTDADITAYIRTGRQEASAQDDRQDVEGLALVAGSADARAAAAKALEGDAAAVTAFLATGQYEAMKQDMRLVVARTIANAGPIEQQAGRTALNTDTTDALRQFITTDDSQARTQDERVRAAQLADTDNKSNGAQLKAAARIALEGPSDLLHAFITVGQYKAQRQDQLAATHEGQIQQLIAQAAGIAATAQKNAAEAGRAAANAAKAASEAEGYRRQAEAAANDAKKYATQANGYAAQAEQSAKDAASSAKTARNAQQDAENAAAAAVTSATSAQYSADSARGSADSAWTAAQNARDSATAAGKDATAAAQAATEAYHTAVVKQQQEEARFRQWVEEQRKKNSQQDDDDGSWIPGWLKDTVNTVSPYAKAFWDNSPQLAADLLESVGGGFITDVGITEGIVGGGGGVLLCPETLGAGCVEAVLAVSGGIAMTGGGLDMANDGVHRFSDDFDQALREAREERAETETCTKCFVAGTKVLMASGPAKNIESIKAGDTVVATDPLTGKTAPRKVTRLIITDGDKHFDEITLDTPDGPRKLTATYEHPFWNPTEKRWVKAHDLRAGSTLLSRDGRTVRVQATRAFDQRVRTYNLTVEDLHTYYVLAGETPVLVHNANPGDCFRGARPGESPNFSPRPNDYKVDPETGFVRETHGVSVFDNSGSVSSKGFIPHQIDESSFPDTLRVIQRGKDPRHFEIVPAPGANLTPERYAEELAKIRTKK